MRTYMHTGLTASPWADTASPAAKTLRAALMSRSWIDPHSGHTHSRTLSGIVAHEPQNLLPFFLFSSAETIRKLSSQCSPQTSRLFKGTMWSTVLPSAFACLYMAAIASMSAHDGMRVDPLRRMALWFLRCCRRCSGSEDMPPFQALFFAPSEFRRLRSLTSSESFHVLPFVLDGLPLMASRCFLRTPGEFATKALAADKSLAGMPNLFMKLRTAHSLHPKSLAISFRDFLSTQYRCQIVSFGIECRRIFFDIKRAFRIFGMLSIPCSTDFVKPESVGSLDFHSHSILDLCKDSKPNGGCERKGHASRAALSLPGMNAGVSRAD